MAKQIGPTFSSEVLAAGLGGLPITWVIGGTDEDITGRENLTTTQDSALQGVIDAHDPTKHLKNIIPTSDFIARFTNQEYAKLGNVRVTDAQATKVGVSKNWDVVITSDSVDLNKQKSQTIKADLVAAGILTQARADEIFS
jgi:hypothetical protein